MKNNSDKGIAEGVNCSVDSCIFNHVDSKVCTAGKINVGPNSAKTKDDTICATFKNRSNSQ